MVIPFNLLFLKFKFHYLKFNLKMFPIMLNCNYNRSLNPIIVLDNPEIPQMLVLTELLDLNIRSPVNNETIQGNNNAQLDATSRIQMLVAFKIELEIIVSNKANKLPEIITTTVLALLVITTTITTTMVLLLTILVPRMVELRVETLLEETFLPLLLLFKRIPLMRGGML